MLRFSVLASAIPLIAVGGLAGGQLTPAAQPCIQLSGTSVRIARAAWQSQQHVSFTTDPMAATVRVQIVDDPALADFAVVDGAEPDELDAAEGAGCTASDNVRYVGISTFSAGSEPVIYLSTEPGDYRVYVTSATFTAQDAAALIVGAHPAPASQLAASL
ncbi:hypothetical protein ACSVBT_21160 [Afipia sp. TerB]